MDLKEALRILDLKPPLQANRVKKAYRHFALRYHPDRNPNNQDAINQFRRCTEAYDFLINNPSLWERVLKTPSADSSQKFSSGSSTQTKNEKVKKNSVKQNEDLGDIFEDIFGFSREGRVLGFQEPQNVVLSLFDVVFGAQKKMKLRSYQKCRDCKGTGAEGHSHVSLCTYCFGRGQIKAKSPQGEFKKCPKCEGRGRHVKQACPVCEGYGRKEVLRLQELMIPPGLKPNEIYTLHSRDLKSQEIYELFIKLTLTEESVFEVEKGTLLCHYPIGQSVAKKGGVIDFPSFWGIKKVRLKAGLQTGDRFKVAEAGLLSSPTGQKKESIVIVITVHSDRKALAEQKKFAKRLQAEKNQSKTKKPSWVGSLLSWFQNRI